MLIRVRIRQCASVPDAMFYSKVLLLLAATTDVFGYSLSASPQVGIAGGQPVSISAVPYMADLRFKVDNSHVCGATIVHERFILTAAHCCWTYQHFPRVHTVAVGTDMALKGVVYGVEKFIIHNSYDYKTVDYDICLIKLSNEITFGPNVTKVKLADKDFELKDGMALNVSGWGYTEKQKKNSHVLRQVSLPFVTQSQCEEDYEGANYKVTDRMICAGGQGIGARMMDSGGPLTNNDVQVGIVSWAGRPIYPTVFTKISVLSSWVNETIASNV